MAPKRGAPRAPTGKPRICVVCGKRFRRPPSMASDYCSRACRWPGVERDCPHCGSAFRTPPSQAQRYCTVECRALATAARNAEPLTAAIVRQCLRYDPSTGMLYWAVVPSGMGDRLTVGQRAGYPSTKGYRRLTIRGTEYAEHRVIWLWMTGEWPADQLDHKNRKKADNRWCNLREATNGQNMINRPRESFAPRGKSVKRPYRGVEPIERLGRYAAVLGAKHIGLFDTAEEAREAYLAASRAAHGSFAVDD